MTILPLALTQILLFFLLYVVFFRLFLIGCVGRVIRVPRGPLLPVFVTVAPLLLPLPLLLLLAFLLQRDCFLRSAPFFNKLEESWGTFSSLSFEGSTSVLMEPCSLLFSLFFLLLLGGHCPPPLAPHISSAPITALTKDRGGLG